MIPNTIQTGSNAVAPIRTTLLALGKARITTTTATELKSPPAKNSNPTMPKEFPVIARTASPMTITTSSATKKRLARFSANSLLASAAKFADYTCHRDLTSLPAEFHATSVEEGEGYHYNHHAN